MNVLKDSAMTPHGGSSSHDMLSGNDLVIAPVLVGVGAAGMVTVG